MNKQTLYKTKPLDCWPKAKEIRRKHYQAVLAAKEKGTLLVSGSATPLPLTPGIGATLHLGGEPWGATIANSPDLVRQALEEAEGQGFAPDMCGYFLCYIGAMHLNRSPLGGPAPRPDLCFTRHECDTHGKWYQLVSEHYKIPYFCIDIPLIEANSDKTPLITEYVVGQCHDYIAWLEKTTGRTFDDEKMIQAIRNDWNSTKLWAEISLLNTAIPAPLDQTQLYSLYVIGMLQRHEKETVELFRMLRDEVQDRIDQQIAALATEHCRVLHDGQPPWYSFKLFKRMEEYGAACVGSYYSLVLSGHFEEENGKLVPARTPDELGVPIRTRDQAIRAMVGWYLAHSTLKCLNTPAWKSFEMLRLVKAYHVDGVLIHLNRGCEGLNFGSMENRLALKEAGIAVATYEGNMADPRQFNEGQTLDRVDAFMESLGLKRMLN